MGKLFGTDGVRGIANTELSPELAFKLGYYGAQILGSRARNASSTRENELNSQNKIKVLVGKDTRLSCDLLEMAICAGFMAAGADVYLGGVLTTPAVALVTNQEGFHLGVMISASHNSYEFNGIKFFDHEGYKLSDEIENEIEDLVQRAKSLEFARPSGQDLGRSYAYPQAEEIYLRHLRYACGSDLKGKKIALDCANGSAYKIAVKLFKELGAELVLLGTSPDGLNINREVGSTNLKNIQEKIIKEACEIGIAFDGDGDRVQVLDHLGNILDGDLIMAILAKYLHKKNKLKDDTLVITVMSNLGLHEFAKKEGFKLEITSVGDRYVLEKMRKYGYSLGGEQSGHIIISQYASTGDGILSALLVLKALKKLNLTPYEARDLVEEYPQVLKAVTVPNTSKLEIMENPSLQERIFTMQEKLGENGRILVRPSGTEPLIRVMLEGKYAEEINKMANELIQLIESLID